MHERLSFFPETFQYIVLLLGIFMANSDQHEGPHFLKKIESTKYSDQIRFGTKVLKTLEFLNFQAILRIFLVPQNVI